MAEAPNHTEDNEEGVVADQPIEKEAIPEVEASSEPTSGKEPKSIDDLWAEHSGASASPLVKHPTKKPSYTDEPTVPRAEKVKRPTFVSEAVKEAKEMVGIKPPAENEEALAAQKEEDDLSAYMEEGRPESESESPTDPSAYFLSGIVSEALIDGGDWALYEFYLKIKEKSFRKAYEQYAHIDLSDYDGESGQPALEFLQKAWIDVQRLNEKHRKQILTPTDIKAELQKSIRLLAQHYNMDLNVGPAGMLVTALIKYAHHKKEVVSAVRNENLVFEKKWAAALDNNTVVAAEMIRARNTSPESVPQNQ